MIVPAIFAIVAFLIHLYYKETSDGCKRNMVGFLKCLLHLPVLQFIQIFVSFRRLSKVAKTKEEVDNFAERMNAWIDENWSTFREDEEWPWGNIEKKFTEKISNDDKKHLEELYRQKYYECFNGQASVRLKALIKAEQMEKEANLARVKSEIQEFKIFEAFGESAPQFILQACAVLHQHPTLDFSELSTREILTLSSSFVSVIWTVSSTFLKLSFIIDGKKEAPFNNSKNYLIVGPLVLLIVTPRLLALTMLYASFRGLFCLIITIIGFITYVVIFWITIWLKQKKDTIPQTLPKREDYMRLMFISFVTSIIGPCVSIDPKSALIFISSSISMIAQVSLMAMLQIVAHFNKRLLVKDFCNEINTFETFYWCLIPIVILTSFMSYFLLEERRQMISLQLGFGPICCDERDQIHWACKREHQTLIHHYLDSTEMVDVVNEINVDGQNAFQFSHDNSKTKAMKILLQHPKNFFDATKVRRIFWKACYRGNIEILKLFLNHPQKQRLFTEKDYDGTGKKTCTRF